MIAVEHLVKEYGPPSPTGFGGAGRFRAVDDVSFEVPAGETVDASAKFCSTFGGGWACAPFALGGTSGREIRATFENVAPVQHVFNACLRNCDDPNNGIWMAYQSDGLQQRDDPDVFVNDVVTPETLVSNGGLGANWSVDLRPASAPDGG